MVTRFIYTQKLKGYAIMTKRKDESSPNLTGTKSQKTDVAPESKPGETPLKAVAPLTPAPDQATQASEIKKKFSELVKNIFYFF